MQKVRKYFLLVLGLTLTTCVINAQNISGVINSYAKVTAISGNQFTIGTPGGKTGASLIDYDIGKRVMIYQAKGISIGTSSGSAYGAPINYNNSGRYELATVTARSGSIVTLSTPVNSYDVSGMVQLVSVPQYTDVTNNGTLSATAWNKSVGYGGIIVLEANRLTLGGHIRTDGAGFAGGAGSTNNSDGCATVYTSTNTKYGAKGESNSTNTTYLRGMSAIGLGGGGGSTHNGGGGGGSNHGYGDDGGRGWSCNASNNGGGRGGHAYAYNQGNQRLFFGGGGGGGQVNNSYNAQGGNGGGIVFLHVNTLRSGNFHYDISSNGGTPPHSIGNDGAGGGGAGGIVYVSAKNYEFQAGQIVLEANGADGGGVSSGAAHGGGGGGGSGVIITATQPPFGVYYSGQNGDAGQDSNAGTSSGNVGYDPPLSQDILVQSDNYVPVMKGPGGHVPGLSAWFVADANYLYTSSTLSNNVTDGNGIQSWGNLANSSNYIRTTGGSTSANFEDDASSLINYNPVVRMNNVNKKLKSVSSLTGQSIIVVTKPTSTSNLNGLVGFENDIGIRANYNGSNWSGDSNSGDWKNGGTSHINGTSTTAHNYKWHIVYQKRGSIYSNFFYAGGYYYNRSFSGDIAEIIVYNDALSSTEQRKIESYLAIKYGISLNKADYIASDGTVIWDKSSHADPSNDIAGIGRDDASNLNQVKSKSINSDAVLTIEAMNAFDDKEFVVWGNDDVALSARSNDVPTNFTERLSRIWQIDITGSTPPISIKLPLAPLGITNASNAGDYRLIANDSYNFSSTTYSRPGSLNATNDTLTFSNVYFSDNEYFTFTTQALSVPGGNSEYMEFLLTAGAGTNTTTEGAEISTWTDQVNSNNAIIKSGTAGPLYRSEGINFNPAVDFTSSNKALRINDATNINAATQIYARTVSIAFKSSTDITSRQVLYEQGGTTRGFNIYIVNSMLYVGAWNTSNDGSGSPWSFKDSGVAINTDQAYVLTFQINGSGSILGVMELFLDGLLIATTTNVGLLYAHDSDIGVGAMIEESRFESPTDDESGDGYYFKGLLGDIVYYKTGIGITIQYPTESALAIKYGVSIDQTSAADYYSSEFNVIWDGSANTSYNNDITALGRDDNSLINQVKSKSTNSSAVLTIANGANFDIPSGIASDLNFMFWAHNGASSSSKTGDYYGLTNSGTARIWKVSEVGTIGITRLQIPKSSIPSDATMLLVSSDPTFPNSVATSTVDLISSGNNWEVPYNFTNNQYFTFGSSNTAPVLSSIESATLNHCDGNSALTAALSIADADNDQITATVQIGTGYVAVEDSLVYVPVAGVTTSLHTKQRIDLNAASITDMQTALRAIQYHNKISGSSKTTGNRTISFTVNDGFVNSNQLTRTLNVLQTPIPSGVYYSN